MFEFKLPDIGEGVAEGEIVKWHVKQGDNLSVDQDMVEVMTDKVTVKIPSPVAGKVKSISVPEGQVVKVGTKLLEIDDGSTEVRTNFGEISGHAEEKHAEKPVTAEIPAPIKETAGEKKVLASPAIRKAARDMGIDLSNVTPTGENGKILMEDLENYKKSIEEKPQQPKIEEKKEEKKPEKVELHEGDEVYEPKGLRRVIFEKMAKSKAVIPHFTIVERVSLNKLKETREELKSKDSSVTFTPLFVKAVTLALKEFPKFNAIYHEANKNYVIRKNYNIGVAVDTSAGLTVVVVKDADKKTVFQLSKEIADLASRARENKLSLSEVQDSTFTVSNVGTIGGIMSTPIINYPEVAILALHRMEETAAGSEMFITLSCDHRLIDGADAARFISRTKELLEKPSLIFVSD